MSAPFASHSHIQKVNSLTFNRKGGMGKRSFLIGSLLSTQRPPKIIRQQIRFFALSAAARTHATAPDRSPFLWLIVIDCHIAMIHDDWIPVVLSERAALGNVLAMCLVLMNEEVDKSLVSSSPGRFLAA